MRQFEQIRRVVRTGVATRLHEAQELATDLRKQRGLAAMIAQECADQSVPSSIVEDATNNRKVARQQIFEVVVEQLRSEEHTSELQSLMRISYAVFCLKKKNNNKLSKA